MVFEAQTSGYGADDGLPELREALKEKVQPSLCFFPLGGVWHMPMMKRLQIGPCLTSAVAQGITQLVDGSRLGRPPFRCSFIGFPE